MDRGVTQAKARFREVLDGLLRNLRVEPDLVVLKWDPAHEIRSGRKPKLEDRRHRIWVHKGAQAVAFHVLESDLRASALEPHSVARYEIRLRRALSNLCGEKMCREDASPPPTYRD